MGKFTVSLLAVLVFTNVAYSQSGYQQQGDRIGEILGHIEANERERESRKFLETKSGTPDNTEASFRRVQDVRELPPAYSTARVNDAFEADCRGKINALKAVQTAAKVAGKITTTVHESLEIDEPGSVPLVDCLAWAKGSGRFGRSSNDSFRDTSYNPELEELKRRDALEERRARKILGGGGK